MLDRARNRLARALEARGLLVQAWPPYYTPEHHLKQLLDELDVDRVIDVGAHIGEYGLLLRRLGYRREIVSFEPTRESYGLLENRASADPSWSTQRLALGGESGTRVLNVWPASVMNSLLPVSEYGKTNYGLGAGGQETVEVRRLDEVATATERTLLKIDTQGTALDVLRGGAGLLSTLAALQVELSAVAAYEDVPSLEESLSTIRGLGFELSGIFRASYDFESSLRLGDVDCFFVRI
jgi:FkbM family methyltransferase